MVRKKREINPLIYKIASTWKSIRLYWSIESRLNSDKYIKELSGLPCVKDLILITRVNQVYISNILGRYKWVCLYIYLFASSL